MKKITRNESPESLISMSDGRDNANDVQKRDEHRWSAGTDADSGTGALINLEGEDDRRKKEETAAIQNDLAEKSWDPPDTKKKDIADDGRQRKEAYFAESAKPTKEKFLPRSVIKVPDKKDRDTEMLSDLNTEGNHQPEDLNMRKHRVRDDGTRGHNKKVRNAGDRLKNIESEAAGSVKSTEKKISSEPLIEMSHEKDIWPGDYVAEGNFIRQRRSEEEKTRKGPEPSDHGDKIEISEPRQDRLQKTDKPRHLVKKFNQKHLKRDRDRISSDSMMQQTMKSQIPNTVPARQEKNKEMLRGQ